MVNLNTKSNLLNRIAEIAVAVLLVASIISQSLVDLCLAVLFFVLIFKWRSDKSQFKFAKIPFIAFMLGYMAVAFLGLANQLGLSQLPWEQMGKFVWILNLAILASVFVNLKVDWIKIVKLASLLSLIPSIYCLATYFVGYDFLTAKDIKRIVGLVNSATYHAHAGGILFVFLIGFFIRNFNAYSFVAKSTMGFSILLLMLSVWFTHTRGIWFALVGSTFLALLMVKPRISMVFAALCLLLGVGAFKMNDRFRTRVLHSMDTNENSDRIDLFNVNIEMFRDYPILGIGYGQNRERNREYWDKPHWNRPADKLISHAHNQYLNVLSTTGVVGFILFSVFFFGLQVRIFRLRRLENKTIQNDAPSIHLLLWSGTFVLLACITDVTFEYAKIRVLILVIWAVGIAYYLQPKQSQPTKN